MITYNLYNKKKCTTDGENIWIDGNAYKIFAINEVKNYKNKTRFQMYILSILGIALEIIALFGLITSIRDDNKLGQCIMLLSVVILGITFSFLFIFLLKTRKYHGSWVVNNYKNVYIEDSDGEQVIRALRSAELHCNSNNGLKPRRWFDSKIDKIVFTIGIGIFCVGYGVTEYISESIGVDMLVASFMFLAVWNIWMQIRRLKWKKS